MRKNFRLPDFLDSLTTIVAKSISQEKIFVSTILVSKAIDISNFMLMIYYALIRAIIDLNDQVWKIIFDRIPELWSTRQNRRDGDRSDSGISGPFETNRFRNFRHSMPFSRVYFTIFDFKSISTNWIVLQVWIIVQIFESDSLKKWP